MKRKFSRPRSQLFSANAWRVHIFLWAGAILVGSVTLLLVKLAEFADAGFIEVTRAYAWLPFVLTPVGLIIISTLTRRFFGGAEGSGIPQVIYLLENQQKQHLLSLRNTFGKLALIVMGLFSGASIGLQGPSVYIGASILYSMRRFAEFPAEFTRRGLIIAGGAAGFAAAFNTPLAGIVFAFEELSRSFEQKTNGIILTAVILAGLTAMALQGNQPYFSVSDARFEFDVSLLFTILLCGVVGGLLGGMFSQLLISGNRMLQPLLRKHPITVVGVLGLIIATAGYLSGYTAVGTGYAEANAIVSGEIQFDPLFALYKFITTMASYFSGIPGGLFTPSLATGAGIGQGLAYYLPIAPASFMILVAMVAYFAGVIQAPITAMVIVLEMTANQNMIFPLMICAFIGSGMSSIICPRSLFRALAEGISDSDSRPNGQADRNS